MFRDPAWDIILDLFAAELDGRGTCSSSAAIASCVPMTTALRCLDQLEERGLVERVEDPRDRRRSMVRLTSDSRLAMHRLMAATAPDLGLVR